MRNYSTDPPWQPTFTNPKNGYERVVTDTNDNTIKHLEIFMNGSWRHSNQKCREYINKDCKRKK
jgi:hypothetical protein